MKTYYPALQSFSAYGINGKSTGATTLGTTENGTQIFVPIFVVYHATTISGFLTAATISVGTNSTSFNNIVPATLLSTLNGSSLSATVFAAGSVVIPANTSISCNNSVGGTGTTLTYDIHVFGFYK